MDCIIPLVCGEHLCCFSESFCSYLSYTTLWLWQKLNVRRSASLQDLITASWASLLAGQSDVLLLRRAIDSAGPHLEFLPLSLLVQLGQVFFR